MRSDRRRWRWAALLAAGGLVVAACGDDSESTSAAPDETTTTAPADGGATDGGDAVSLAGVCPDPLVIQTDWFPESDHGWTYQLIGPDGTVDADKGAYSGPLGDTGITLEIRAGGPFIGFQPPVAQMYSDDSIFAGYVDTGDQIRNSKALPTTAVFAPLDKSPQILMYDPEQHDFESFEDVGASGARVLYFEGSVYMDWLVAKGFIDKAQVDGSYDGSPASFVSSGGAVVQQGYATHEPYDYEHTVEGWMKPVDFLLVHDAGYEIYQSALALKPEAVAEYGDCLKALVPLMQQAEVDYMADPAPVNGALVRIAEELATFWTLTEDGNADTTRRMADLGIVQNAPDGTLGTMDAARIQQLIDDLLPIFEGQNLDTYDPDVAPEDLYTNEFLDPDIGL